MIRTYILKIERKDGTDQIVGQQYIHNAIVDCLKEPDRRKVVMDTTDNEHNLLKDLAITARSASAEEKAALAISQSLIPACPPRDLGAEIDELKARVSKLEVS